MYLKSSGHHRIRRSIWPLGWIVIFFGVTVKESSKQASSRLVSRGVKRPNQRQQCTVPSVAASIVAPTPEVHELTPCNAVVAPTGAVSVVIGRVSCRSPSSYTRTKQSFWGVPRALVQLLIFSKGLALFQASGKSVTFVLAYAQTKAVTRAVACCCFIRSAFRDRGNSSPRPQTTKQPLVSSTVPKRDRVFL